MSDDLDRIHVLHVDDDPDFATLTTRVLENECERLEVLTASSADEGLDRLETAAVDCVVSDYDMAGRNGIEFLEAVRERYEDLPFILFTGKGSEEIAAEAVRAGATDYLQKSAGTDQYALLANRVTNAAERYATERELQETHRRFRKLLERSADYVHVIDPDGTVEYVSPAVERALGYEPEAIVGESAFAYIHPEDRSTTEAMIGEVTDEPGAETTAEVRVRHADGDWRWVEMHARNLLDEPTVEGIVANARDITDRRESEATADWHRTVIGNLGEGVYVLDADYRFQFVSHRVDEPELLEAEWVGEPVSMLADTGVVSATAAEEIRQAVDDILAGPEQEVRLEVEPTIPEDAKAVELHFRQLPAPDGEDVVLGTSRDVTDRKRRAARLRALHDVTREMVVARGHDAVAEAAVEAVEDILGLGHATVFRYDGDRDALVPAVDRVEGGTPQAEIPAVGRGEGVAWQVYETGETAVLPDVAGAPEACNPGSAVESELLVPLGEHGILATGSTTRREFDDQTVSLAELLAANLTAACAQADRARELEGYERLVETMGDSVYSIDLDGEYLRVNETFAALTGYDADRLLAEGPELILSDRGMAQFEAAVRRLLEGERGIETVETTLHTADGDAVPVETNLTCMPDESGGYRGTVGVIRDTSERREREQELERYETIVRAFPDEVYTLDADGYLTSVIPPAGSEMTTTGYDPEELVGEHVSVVMPEEDIEQGEELIQELLSSADKQTTSFAMQTVRRDGERVPHENHIALLPTVDGEFSGTVGVLRNIADRKQRERELRRQNDRLQKFASFVSHDLRNPLNVASTRLELAQRECNSPHLDDIGAAHERMSRLIDAVLTLAREGEQPEAVEELSLESLAEQCWAHVDTGEATLAIDTDRTVHAEEARVQQLLENLVRNAVEHGSHARRDPVEHGSVGGRRQTGGAVDHGEEPVSVRVGDLPDGFYVEDDGPGIPPEERGEVFEAGYSTAEEGTGLGLNIVEEIAEAHGWAVDVTEGSEGGARFEFTDVS